MDFVAALEALGQLEGVPVAIVVAGRQGSVGPIAVFAGTLGTIEMSEGMVEDRSSSLAFVPVIGGTEPGPDFGNKSGFYVDAATYLDSADISRVVAGKPRKGLAIMLADATIQVEQRDPVTGTRKEAPGGPRRWR